MKICTFETQLVGFTMRQLLDLKLELDKNCLSVEELTLGLQREGYEMTKVFTKLHLLEAKLAEIIRICDD